MIETLLLGILGNAFYDLGQDRTGRVADVLGRDDYDQERARLAETFEEELQRELAAALEAEDVDSAVVADHWAAIGEHLDGLELALGSRTAAVADVSEAIATALEAEGVETVPVDAVNRAVARSYRTVVDRFVTRARDSDLGDTLAQETGLRVAETVDEVDARMEQLEALVTRQLAGALGDEGFRRLDPVRVRQLSSAAGDPVTAWRAGFALADVAAGYAVERRSLADDCDTLTAELVDRLRDGEDLVVVGGPGTGKSTVCKRVALRWATEAPGTVLYRDSETLTAFDSPGTVAEAVDATDTETLVIVEDALDESARAVHDLRETVDDEAATFLLDARETAWENRDDRLSGARLRTGAEQLSPVRIPVLDEAECRRAIEQFESVTDDDVTVHRSPGALFEAVASADVGRPLELGQRLTGAASGGTGPDDVVSGVAEQVESTVRELERRAETDGDPLPLAVGVMVNVLNAAGLPVAAPLVQTLEGSDWTIRGLLDDLEGTVIVADDGDGEVPAGPETYRTVHEAWSVLFLETCLDDLGTRPASDLFERCVGRLFALVDGEAAGDDATEVLAGLGDDRRRRADSVVEAVARIGTGRYSLAPLYLEASVTPPDACSTDAEYAWALSLSKLYFGAGHLEAASDLLEDLAARLDDREPSTTADRRHAATVANRRGLIAEVRGDLDAAEAYHEESLAIERDLGNRRGRAASLDNLGLVAQTRGDLDAAEAYHEESLAIERDLGNRRGEARSLTSLGVVARRRGDLETAETSHEEALAVFREVGDRQGEARSLTNLGEIAQTRGDLETAEARYEESLAIFRDLGHREGVARSLTSLGGIDQIRGDLEAAEARYEEGLAIFREIGHREGEATSLSSLGLLARRRGDLETAEAHYEESLAIARETGDREGEAQALASLGDLARRRDSLDAAESYHEEALAVFREIDDPEGEATALDGLGLIAQARGDLAAAETSHEEALAVFREVGDREGEARSLVNLGVIARRRGSLDEAETYYEEALDIFRAIDDRHGEAQSLTNLGDLAREQGDTEAAEAYQEEGLAIFRAIGDREGVARALGNLGLVAETRGELERARSRHREAADTFVDVGIVREGLAALGNLVDVCVRLGDDAAAVDACQRGADLAEAAGLSDRAREFEAWVERIEADGSDGASTDRG